jgi:apolipoprotein D and lipocalin family protein
MMPTMLLLVTLAAGQQAPVQTVSKVDLDRYLGEWFEIARLPNRFQRKCTGNVRALYSRRGDEGIEITNRCTKTEGIEEAQGQAKVVDRATNAKLKVRFAPAFLSWLPAVWGDYWIIGLADDYSWAVVGSPDRKFLWILARTPSIDAATYDRVVEIARRNGFDVGRLEKSGGVTAPRE